MSADHFLCMRLHRHGTPLVREVCERPTPASGQVLLKVRACGVCRTDLHVVDGELPEGVLPIVPGHEIVGEVVACGAGVAIVSGTRVGVPWLGWTCGQCEFCRSGRENLCDTARFTGYQLDGGYAQHVLADARYCFELPATMDDVHAAPLLCAGLIGYRSWRMAGPGKRLGLYGFGAAAHIVIQIARWSGQEVYAFTRRGDAAAQQFALSMGAQWAGSSEDTPPQPLDAAIIFAPAGELVPAALRALRKGGTLVCGGIHMSDLPAMPYRLLWEERVVRSVANLTRSDGVEFLELAAKIPVATAVEVFPLTDANVALQRLRSGDLRGAAVLVP
ncbi:MAG TPA: zinc-dependent alcohol dehydrogenase family protein [Povalibacter sp.]|uniref:zinc-dependent alcohol dehydrogenase family protein n=1 Tax=Povalibacter sp. TaxID=1962978 RepID=UPI002B6BCBA4|nr:zinc-dependent alcohol dehydrogenase family protein [Povalibacter sp.]HMN46358.1 zinc-dependent alcohol dehydrogenase family protein [Povalibacter sp.]